MLAQGGLPVLLPHPARSRGPCRPRPPRGNLTDDRRIDAQTEGLCHILVWSALTHAILSRMRRCRQWTKQSNRDLHQSKPELYERCTRVNAHWKGDVAASMWWPISCAKVFATTRLRISPTTIPLAPPPGFLEGTILPSLMASKISRGMLMVPPAAPSCTKTEKPIAIQGRVNLWSVSHHLRRDGNPGLTWSPSLILQNSQSGVVPWR